MTPLTLVQQTAVDAMRPFHPRTRQRVDTLLDWYEDGDPGWALSPEDRRMIVRATVGWLSGTAEYVRLADMTLADEVTS